MSQNLLDLSKIQVHTSGTLLRLRLMSTIQEHSFHKTLLRQR